MVDWDGVWHEHLECVGDGFEITKFEIIVFLFISTYQFVYVHMQLF